MDRAGVDRASLKSWGYFPWPPTFHSSRFSRLKDRVTPGAFDLVEAGTHDLRGLDLGRALRAGCVHRRQKDLLKVNFLAT